MRNPASRTGTAPIVVEVTRGDLVEARDLVHAVAVRGGQIELAAGDPQLDTFLRSSAKPPQALPVVRARPDLDDEQVALLCASHRATPEQLAVVRRILADAPATEDDLECGAEPTRIAHNCSGKHRGVSRALPCRGLGEQRHRLLDHRCQQAMRREVAAAARSIRRRSRSPSTCKFPTFGMTLERAAHAFTAPLA